MIRMRMNIAILLLAQAVLAQNSSAAVSNELDKFNLYYINGIDAPEHKARKSAVLTGQRINQPGRVKSIYNFSDGLILDLIETFQAAGYDGGRNDTTPFWEWMNDRSLMPSSYLSAYWSLFAAHSSAPASMQASLIKAKNTIDADRSTSEKAIIFAHSQGNFLANFLIDSVTRDDQHLGESCTGTVAVGTPATYVANGDPWVTNANDSTINDARLYLPFGSSIKPANASNPATILDPSGHFYNETYLMSPSDTLNKIEIAAITVADRLNQECASAACGQALEPAGGQGLDQQFIYSITNQSAHEIAVHFEAYSIPDRLQIYSESGQLLLDTNTEISGYFQGSINYDPNVHGAALVVEVDAPFTGTAWKLCIDCLQGGSGCSFVQTRKDVSYQFYTGDHNWNCSINGLYIDGQLLNSTSFGSQTLTKGDHSFTWDGFCYCDSLNFCSNGPYVNIDGVKYFNISSDIPFTIQ